MIGTAMAHSSPFARPLHAAVARGSVLTAAIELDTQRNQL